MEKINYEQFLMYLRQFQNKIQKSVNEDLKHYNISSTHIGILMILKKEINGCSMSELSRLTKVDNALMTRNISELEKINYIYRNRKRDSQRKYHICLTEKGQNIAKEMEEIIKKRKKEFLKNFTKEEQNILLQAIEIMIKKFILLEKEEKNVRIKKS